LGHSGEWGLTNHLVDRNYSVTAYDHRGHGLSDGLPGHVESFAEYDEDLTRMLKSVRSRSQVKPLFLIGHSMGGLIALRYAARNSNTLSGAIISAPLIEVAVPVPAHKLMIARVSARMAPRMRLTMRLTVNRAAIRSFGLCRGPARQSQGEREGSPRLRAMQEVVEGPRIARYL
jgi:alpha-beta hydrolase superfamily lysophospholipase